MVDVTLVCLAALLAVTPDRAATASSASHDAPVPGIVSARAVPESDGSRPFWRPSATLEEAVIRAQSADSPYYQELPSSPGAGGVPQYPYAPGAPASPVPGTAVPGNPPDFGASPYAPGGFGAPAGPTPYDPFTGQPPAATGQFQTYGVNGPQPFRFGPQPKVDVGYITREDASGGYGDLDVIEFDTEMPWARPTGSGDVFTVTPQFDVRLFDGPTTQPPLPGFPNDLYRFGTDFEYSFLNPAGQWSGEIGFNPSINTDFEKSLTMDAVNWDGRAIGYFKASPTLTVVLGAMYLDRVDDRLLPYAGVIVTPNDRLEVRLVFPEPRIEYFSGYMWGKPTWVYARGEYHVEAFEVEVPPGRGNQVEIEDYRVLVGARKEQGWGDTYLEAGYVFNRSVEYDGGAPGFEVGNAWIFRGGVRF